MDFSEALNKIKEGKKVTREAWKVELLEYQTPFCFLVNGSTFAVSRAPLLGIYPEGTIINYQPHIDIKTIDGSIVPWNCQQTDLLATDYSVVE